jgi:hypothetical protein
LARTTRTPAENTYLGRAALSRQAAARHEAEAARRRADIEMLERRLLDEPGQRMLPSIIARSLKVAVKHEAKAASFRASAEVLEKSWEEYLARYRSTKQAAS